KERKDFAEIIVRRFCRRYQASSGLLLIAQRVHQGFEGGALGGVRWKVRQARKAGGVTVEVAGVLEAAGAERFGEGGGIADAGLLLFGEGDVAVFPSSVDLIASLGRACGEGGRDTGCAGVQGIKQ